MLQGLDAHEHCSGNSCAYEAANTQAGYLPNPDHHQS